MSTVTTTRRCPFCGHVKLLALVGNGWLCADCLYDAASEAARLGLTDAVQEAARVFDGSVKYQRSLTGDRHAAVERARDRFYGGRRA
jgi:ribosomal protein S27AE